jgi:hypothetical protein
MVLLLIVIVVAGAVGGVVNALLTDNGFIKPRKETTSAGVDIYRPGFIGNIIIGAVAAGISWGLYGPLASYVLLGSTEAIAKNPSAALGISLSTVVGAVLIGIGGAKWLTNEVDKRLLKAAAVEAAKGKSSPDASARMAMSSPSESLNIAKSL